MMRFRASAPIDDRAGDTLGLVFVAGGKRVVYAPGIRDLDDAFGAECARADVILLDGTFFTDDELIAMGASTRSSRTMGHAPQSGAGGSIEFLSRFPRARRVLIHINNSNPILDATSAARGEVVRAGIEIAHDGLDIVA
jgi:pyrroloquinoline quinone biosynthesis protein B